MASAEHSGTWRLVGSDSEESIRSPPLFTTTTQRSSSAAKAYPTDRDAFALPTLPGSKWLDEGQKLVLEELGDAAATIESEESNGTIPCEMKDKATGVIVDRDLRVGDAGTADFSGFNSTDDVVVNTSQFVRLGAFTVPTGKQIRLKAGGRAHLYLGDNQ
jgi:hypothetical protein